MTCFTKKLITIILVEISTVLTLCIIYCKIVHSLEVEDKPIPNNTIIGVRDQSLGGGGGGLRTIARIFSPDVVQKIKWFCSYIILAR